MKPVDKKTKSMTEERNKMLSQMKVVQKSRQQIAQHQQHQPLSTQNPELK